MANEFISRARTYAQWDCKLADRTRFFAAAAVTNAAFAYLEARRIRLAWISESTLTFLSTAGCLLQSINLYWARYLHISSHQLPDLDREMVVREQFLLQRALSVLRNTEPTRYRNLVRQIDRVLAWLSHTNMSVFCDPSVSAFAVVLGGVAREAGRPASFARWEDRVRIGSSLVLYIRQRFRSPTDLAAHFLL